MHAPVRVGRKGAGMTRSVALLRGVNVGAAQMSMDRLRAVFEDLGHTDVTTYLRTGNVVFTAGGRAAAVAKGLERRIADDLGVETTVLLRTAAELTALVAANPFLDRESDLAKLH